MLTVQLAPYNTIVERSNGPKARSAHTTTVLTPLLLYHYATATALLCTHSKEPYILDFVQAALAKGSTVCVMVARGLMSTPVVGESLFHGARTSDVEATVAALCSAVGAATPLALVGFSM
jgi:predicted alpha/beta-fold hydrolase